jgi:hypothetical protein
MWLNGEQTNVSRTISVLVIREQFADDKDRDNGTNFIVHNPNIVFLGFFKCSPHRNLFKIKSEDMKQKCHLPCV